MLIEMDHHVIGLNAKVVKSFQGLGHEGSQYDKSENFKAHAYRFLLCEILGTDKSKTLPPHNEVCDFLN